MSNKCNKENLKYLKDYKEATLSIDKATTFSLRLPKFRFLINKVGIYYQLFYIDPNIPSYDQVKMELGIDFDEVKLD